MKVKLPEEIIRMIRYADDLYFNQIDICRILEKLEKKCHTLDGKRIIKEASRMFSCISDINENGK